MSVVHGIVISHGGLITVKSKINKGTTFRVFFPQILPVLEDEFTSPDQQIIHGGNEHILFVDDEEELTHLAEYILGKLGYKVDVRSSSVEALKAFKNNPKKYDLVITDMNMPKMTGDQLAKNIIAIRRDIPIILCTGFSEIIDEKQAKAIGINEFVYKPLVKKEFAKVVRKALDDTN